MKNTFKRFLSIALSIIMVMTMMPMVSFAADETTNVAAIGETEYATLAKAIEAAKAGDTITLIQDVTFNEKITIAKDVKITGDHTITRADNYTGTLFEVKAGATITLDGGLVIDGNNNWAFNAEKYEEDLKNNVSVATGFNDYVIPEEGAPIATAAMFTVNGAVVMNKATIQNHVGNANQRVFYVNGTKENPGSLTMNDGATITHCATAGKGTAAWLEVGNFTMENGAKITNNYGSQHSALINLAGGSTFTMNGGEISGNRGAASNGSVIMIKTGTFTMNDGIITNNSSVIGSGGGNTPVILLYNSISYMYMNGGEISNNTGYVTGGVMLREKGGQLVITDGKIYNNTSSYSNGVYNDIYSGVGGVTVSGGTFTQDVSAWVADDSIMGRDEETGAYVVKERMAAKIVVDEEEVEFKTLAEAIAAANAMEDGATVTLLQDATFSENFIIKKNITITGAYTITRADNYTGALFTVNAGATLTLDGGLVIDGGNEWIFDEDGYEAALWANNVDYSGFAFVTSEAGAPIASSKMITISAKGSVVMNEATIQNHMGGNQCGLFSVSGSLTLNEGATLKHNASSHTSTIASVADGALVTINKGALITGNYYAKNGGLFQTAGMIVMNGGEISHNRGVNTNGTVAMLYTGNPQFILNDGLICDNSSVRGSGAGRCAPFYLRSSTDKFEMHGGSICCNVSPGYGGIDGYHGGSTITITGGYIGDNVSIANSKYADIYVNAGYCTATISGGTFTQDVSKWLAPGVGLIKDENGLYSTTTEVAEYDGKKFTSIHKALIAAHSGDRDAVKTVKVLVDHEIDLNVNWYDCILLSNGYKIILDLNGKTITADWSKFNKTSGEYGLFVVANGGQLTVTGNGTVINKSSGDKENLEAHIFYHMTGHKERQGILTIENGTYYQYDNTQILYSQGHKESDPVIDQKTYVMGGTFISMCEDEAMKNDFFNAIDGNKQYTEITGGSFTMYPGDWELTIPEGYCASENVNAEGYYTVQTHSYVGVYTEPTIFSDGFTTYTCTFCNDEYSKTAEGTMLTPAAKIGEDKYATLAEAMAAANKVAGNYTITLFQDNAEVFTFAQKNGVNITIDGNGKTFTGKITLSAGAGELTIKNATLTPTVKVSDKLTTASIVLSANSAPKVTIDNCILKNTNATGAIVWGNASYTKNEVVITNSTASNLQYLVGANQVGCENITIENVTATDMAYLIRPMKATKVTVKNVTYSGMTFIQVKNSNIAFLNIENVNVTTTYDGLAPVSMLAPDTGVGELYTITLKGESYVNGVKMTESSKDIWFVCQKESTSPYIIQYIGNCDCNGELELIYVASTCTFGGYSYYRCKNCMEKETDPEKYDNYKLYYTQYRPLGHAYDENNVKITEATCTSEGSKVYLCLRCGEEDRSRVETFKKKSHAYLTMAAAVEPTCEMPGCNELKYCVNCGNKIGGELVAPLGHDVDENGNCKRCHALQYDGEDGSDFCTCHCHATGIKKIVYKILRFFWKIMGKNQSCDCGAIHY